MFSRLTGTFIKWWITSSISNFFMNDSYYPAASGHWLFSMRQWNMLKYFCISPLPRKSIPVIRVGPESLFFVSMWRFVHLWSYTQYGSFLLKWRIFRFYCKFLFKTLLFYNNKRISIFLSKNFLYCFNNEFS